MCDKWRWSKIMVILYLVCQGDFSFAGTLRIDLLSSPSYGANFYSFFANISRAHIRENVFFIYSGKTHNRWRWGRNRRECQISTKCLKKYQKQVKCKSALKANGKIDKLKSIQKIISEWIGIVNNVLLRFAHMYTNTIYNLQQQFVITSYFVRHNAHLRAWMDALD